MFMKNTPPAVSTLDRLLYQSLLAATFTKTHSDNIVAHLLAVLTRIANFYRGTVDTTSQCVIEPAGAALEVEGHALRCPRLLVQGTRMDMAPRRSITLVYTPTRPDCITLQVAYDDTFSVAPGRILWMPLRNDWYVDEETTELDAPTHANFVLNALNQAKLFSFDTMTLEPKTT